VGVKRPKPVEEEHGGQYAVDKKRKGGPVKKGAARGYHKKKGEKTASGAITLFRPCSPIGTEGDHPRWREKGQRPKAK